MWAQESLKEKTETLRSEPVVLKELTFSQHARNLPPEAEKFWQALKDSHWAKATTRNQALTEVRNRPICLAEQGLCTAHRELLNPTKPCHCTLLEGALQTVS